MRAWCRGNTAAFQAAITGSTPVARSISTSLNLRENMERLNQIKQPEIIRTPWVESKYIDDESRFERLVFNQKKERFDIQLSQRDDGLWFWAVSCHTGNAGFCYGLFEGCGTYTKERQEAINAAVLEIVDWVIRDNKLSNNCVEWLLNITQSIAEQEELF